MKNALLFLLGFILSINVFAQSDSLKIGALDSLTLTGKRNDSLINEQLYNTSELLRKSDSTRTMDSIYKLQLLKDIESLKSNESSKRNELLDKIKEIETSESIRREEKKQSLLKLKATTKGFPVAPFSDTIFFVFSKTGPLSPNERAKILTNKIIELEDEQFFQEDSLFIFPNEASQDIMYINRIIMSINDFDAMWFDKTKEVLAEEYLGKIKSAILAQRDQTSLKKNLIRIGLVILILFGAYILIRGINYVFGIFEKKLIPIKQQYIKGVQIKSYEILDVEMENKLFDFVFKWIRIFTIIIVIYLTLPLLFSVFPWTKAIAIVLISWVLDPVKKVLTAIGGYLPNLFTILVIYFLVRYMVRGVKFIATEIESGKLKLQGFYADWAQPTFHIVKILLYAFMFVVIFPYLPGSDSNIFKGVSVFLGILFSLGSSTAIANAVAGYVITYMRPFKIGDRVKIGEVVGDVIEKTVLVTRIRTPKNEEVTVPNASILSGQTTNYSNAASENGLILYSTVTIGYDVPWRKVHELLIASAAVTQGIMKEPKPFVLQTSLDDFYVSYQLNAYTREASKMSVMYSDIHQNIQDKFNEGGVEILSPHYRGQRDGNAITIPADYLPKGYVPPPFNVNIKKEE